MYLFITGDTMAVSNWHGNTQQYLHEVMVIHHIYHPHDVVQKGRWYILKLYGEVCCYIKWLVNVQHNSLPHLVEYHLKYKVKGYFLFMTWPGNGYPGVILHKNVTHIDLLSKQGHLGWNSRCDQTTLATTGTSATHWSFINEYIKYIIYKWVPHIIHR